MRPMSQRPLYLVAAAFVVLAGALGVAALLLSTPGGTARPIPTPGATVGSATTGPGGVADIDTRVAFWEARVAANEEDLSSTLALIDAYLERTRTEGDLADLERAQVALEHAREIGGDSAPVELRAGQVAYSLHDFGAAREAAERMLELDPGDAAGLALLGDAQVEIGDEEAAGETYQLLAAAGRAPGILSRLARYAYLYGDLDGAIEMVQEGVLGARTEGFAETIATLTFQLGELYRGANRLDDAAAAYEEGLAALPDHVPSLGGLARVREAQGRRGEAIELLERATTRLPTPAFVADLGDLYQLDGRTEEAEDRYALVERIAEVARATGAVYDRQLVLFFADHERSIDEAVELAEAEIERRTDVYGYDALAWVLYRAGRIDEAADAAASAMRIGTPDGRILYHAGLIAAADGRPEEAVDLLTRARDRSTALSPLQVPALDAALAELGA